MLVIPVQESKCQRADAVISVPVNHAATVGLDLVTVKLLVPFPVPVLAFLREETRDDACSLEDCLVTTVIDSIYDRFEHCHRNSRDQNEVAACGHLLSLLTELGELRLARDRETGLPAGQQEPDPLHATASTREDGMVAVELAVPVPVPVLAALQQQALEEGHDFEFDLVITLLQSQKDLFALDIPADPSNDRYRELYTLLDEAVFNLMQVGIQGKQLP